MSEVWPKEHEGCHPEHSAPQGVILNCACGGFSDLSNMPTDGAVLARVSIDTSLLSNPRVKVDFNSMLSFRLTMLEEMDLVYTLYRSNEKGEMTELASWPYKVLMDQLLTSTEEDYAYVTIEKNESFYTSFCDDLSCGGYYTYLMKVQTNYFNVTNAVIQSSFISVTAQSGYQGKLR